MTLIGAAIVLRYICVTISWHIEGSGLPTAGRNSIETIAAGDGQAALFCTSPDHAEHYDAGRSDARAPKFTAAAIIRLIQRRIHYDASIRSLIFNRQRRLRTLFWSNAKIAAALFAAAILGPPRSERSPSFARKIPSTPAPRPHPQSGGSTTSTTLPTTTFSSFPAGSGWRSLSVSRVPSDSRNHGGTPTVPRFRRPR